MQTWQWKIHIVFYAMFLVRKGWSALPISRFVSLFFREFLQGTKGGQIFRSYLLLCLFSKFKDHFLEHMDFLGPAIVGLQSPEIWSPHCVYCVSSHESSTFFTAWEFHRVTSCACGMQSFCKSHGATFWSWSWWVASRRVWMVWNGKVLTVVSCESYRKPSKTIKNHWVSHENRSWLNKKSTEKTCVWLAIILITPKTS